MSAAALAALPIRCRLSDGIAYAIPFSASDPTTLRAGAERALARYTAERGALQVGALELQVRPITEIQERIGWFAPLRGARYVVVRVSAAILDRRPPDDWTEIWEWVVASRAADRALAGFVAGVAAWSGDVAPGADGT